jgi:hypothetical protein
LKYKYQKLLRPSPWGLFDHNEGLYAWDEVALLAYSLLHITLEVSYHHTTNIKENLKIAHFVLNFEN